MPDDRALHYGLFTIAGLALLLSVLGLARTFVLLLGCAIGAVGGVLFQPPSRITPLRPSTAQPSPVPAPEATEQLDVPAVLVEPISVLRQFVVADFVTLWYRSSISLGDERFIWRTEGSLNGTINTLVARLSRMQATEVGIYGLHSISQALIAELQMAEGDDDEPINERALQQRIRETCEELVTVMTPKSLLSPVSTPLLTEIVTLIVRERIVDESDADRSGKR